MCENRKSLNIICCPGETSGPRNNFWFNAKKCSQLELSETLDSPDGN